MLSWENEKAAQSPAAVGGVKSRKLEWCHKDKPRKPPLLVKQSDAVQFQSAQPSPKVDPWPVLTSEPESPASKQQPKLSAELHREEPTNQRDQAAQPEQNPR